MNSSRDASAMPEGYSDRELETMMADLESDLVEPSAQDERILNERRRYRDPHYDSSAVRTATVDDLRVGRFMDEYLPAAVDAETLAANDRSASTPTGCTARSAHSRSGLQASWVR